MSNWTCIFFSCIRPGIRGSAAPQCQHSTPNEKAIQIEQLEETLQHSRKAQAKQEVADDLIETHALTDFVMRTQDVPRNNDRVLSPDTSTLSQSSLNKSLDGAEVPSQRVYDILEVSVQGQMGMASRTSKDGGLITAEGAAQESIQLARSVNGARMTINPQSRLLRGTISSHARSISSSGSNRDTGVSFRPSSSLNGVYRARARSDSAGSTGALSTGMFSQFNRSETYGQHPGSRTRERIGLSR